ncbi:MAG TPA: intradiol ring-cleavage dioxygenase [Saprospiraceae bacterium]|nr:intradiol ring-cleavage dioxygenase [Saprospiraceae bacterium]HMQ84016.1 intradiol ring-cleavage dioxygenase [Saprospiraceae bacterium]
MKQYIFFPILSVFGIVSCQPKTAENQSQTPVEERAVGGLCECCEAWSEGLPDVVKWETNLASEAEPGIPIRVSGTIYTQDGRTPAANVLLYVYHTDDTGLYSDGSKLSDCTRRHGHLRGWMKTDVQGQYAFRTIRPAAYPNSRIPAHIHAIIKEPGLKNYWIADYFFDDDPFLSEKDKQDTLARGGNGVLQMEKNEPGIWEGKRDIVLGKHVPGY